MAISKKGDAQKGDERTTPSLDRIGVRRVPGHDRLGVNLHLSGGGALGCHRYQMKLGVQGDFWRGIPHWMASMAGFALPLRVTPNREGNSGAWTCSIPVGHSKLSHERLLSELQRLVEDGDRCVAFELLAQDGRTKLDSLAVAPSAVRAAFAEQRDWAAALDPQPASYGRRTPSLVMALPRLLFCLALFTVAVYALLLRPAHYLPRVPTIWAGPDTTVSDVLPLHPTDMLQAFHLGQLHRHYTIEQDKGTLDHVLAEQMRQRRMAELLRTARDVLPDRTAEVTWPELRAVPDELQRLADHMGLVARVRGFFTFVNLVWFIGIFGIAISIGPVIILTVGPFLSRIAIGLFRRLVLPLLRVLHEWGVFEAGTYLLALVLVADGLKMRRRALGVEAGGSLDVGFFAALTGFLVLAPLGCAYSVLLHGIDVVKSLSPLWASRVGSLLALGCLLVPATLLLDSVFCAYLCTAILLQLLGFSVLTARLCIAIGFKSKDALVRSVITCAAVLVLWVVLRSSGALASHPKLHLWSSPVSVLCSLAMYLGLLIGSSVCSDTHWAPWQFLMLSALLFGFFCGNVFGLPGLANTAITFASLYAAEKYVAFHNRNKWNPWLLMLSGSVALYYFALWAHAHPLFMRSLFELAAEA